MPQHSRELVNHNNKVRPNPVEFEQMARGYTRTREDVRDETGAETRQKRGEDRKLRCKHIRGNKSDTSGVPVSEAHNGFLLLCDLKCCLWSRKARH